MIKTFLRRKYLIEPKVQLPIVLYCATFTILVVAALYLVQRISLTSILLSSSEIRPDCAALLAASREVLNEELNWVFLLSGLVAVLFSIVGGVMVTHRIVGPIHRLRKLLPAILTESGPHSFKVRRHDHFKDLFLMLEELCNEREKKE